MSLRRGNSAANQLKHQSDRRVPIKSCGVLIEARIAQLIILFFRRSHLHNIGSALFNECNSIKFLAVSSVPYDGAQTANICCEGGHSEGISLSNNNPKAFGSSRVK